MKEAWNNSIVAILSQLCPILLLKVPVFPPIIQDYELSSEDDKLGDQDRSVASLPIMHVSIDEKEEESMDIEGCMQEIDSLVDGDFIASKEEPVVEEKFALERRKSLLQM
ncbi:hypothetical protein J1N35_005070 [Gossypium stocksii]|uniref:Uncharacterized protein n=1 Tax=Gossypium stocksii TaxID=47602 RepID=A0A9D4AIX2_9ROSI|nr:hypothetical protein J1N35_005070 [Gossypium stocksii]